MSLSELKTVINDIIDDYNLDIILLVSIIILGLYFFFIVPLLYVTTTEAIVDGHMINVTSRASGQITQCYILKDQEVKKGDLLMEIDSSDYEKELAKLDSDIEQNKEKLKILTNNISSENSNNNQKIIISDETIAQKKEAEQSTPPKYRTGSTSYTNFSKTYEPEDIAQQNLIRKKTILGDSVKNISDNIKTEENIDSKSEEKSINKTTVDFSKDTIFSITNTIKNLESQKNEVKLRLSGTKIYAPRDGIISHISVSRGDEVNLSDVLCTLLPKQVWIIAKVNQEDLDKIKIGQSVNIRIPYYKHRIFKGTISSVDLTTKINQTKNNKGIIEIGTDGQIIHQQNSIYQIKIDFIEDYSDFKIVPNSFVSAKILVFSFDN